MENNVATSERHGIISMLSELLEKVKHHDNIVDRINDKKDEIKEVKRQIAIPRKRFSFLHLFFGIIFIVIGWIILLTVFLVRRSKYKKRQAELAEKKAALMAELDILNAELDSYIADELNPFLSTIVPDRYPARYCMRADAIEHMLCLAVDLRGDTIKEIINLYEEECHRARVEGLLGGVIKSTKIAAANAARAADASEVAASNAAAAAIAAGAAATAASRPTEVDVRVENNITIS